MTKLTRKYTDFAKLYLALFARTPNPFNATGAYKDPTTGETVKADSIPDYIPKSNIVRDPMTEGDLLSSLQGPDKLSRSQGNRASRLTPRQIQATQRKALLRNQSIQGDAKNPTFPLMSNADVLKESQTTLSKPDVRQLNNDIAVVDRHKRSIANQLLDREKGLPPIDERRLAEAQQRLQGLPSESWDLLTNVNTGLKDIRTNAKPVETVISEKTSPIGLSAKSGVVSDLKQRAAQGADTSIPSYVANPDSVRYATDPSAPVNRSAMKVAYTPKAPGEKTGLQGKLDKISRVRESVTPSTGVNPNVYKGLANQTMKPSDLNVEDARALLQATIANGPAEPSVQSPPLSTPKQPSRPFKAATATAAKVAEDTAQDVSTAASIPFLQKAKRFLDERPNLTKVGTGLAGAGAVLAGGNLIAKNLADRRQEDEMRRQQSLYNYQV